MTSPSEEIQDLRKKIDNIDERLLDTLKERFAVSTQIGRLKKKHGWPIEDISREEKQFLALDKKSALIGLNSQTVRNIFSTILDEVKKNTVNSNLLPKPFSLNQLYLFSRCAKSFYLTTKEKESHTKGFIGLKYLKTFLEKHSPSPMKGPATSPPKWGGWVEAKGLKLAFHCLQKIQGAYKYYHLYDSFHLRQHNLFELAALRYVFGELDIKLDTITVVYLNEAYRREEALDYNQLFRTKEIDKDRLLTAAEIGGLLEGMGSLPLNQVPPHAIGNHCKEKCPAPLSPNVGPKSRLIRFTTYTREEPSYNKPKPTALLACRSSPRPKTLT